MQRATLTRQYNEQKNNNNAKEQVTRNTETKGDVSYLVRLFQDLIREGVRMQKSTMKVRDKQRGASAGT